MRAPVVFGVGPMSLTRVAAPLLLALASCALCNEPAVCTAKGCPVESGLRIQVTPTITNSLRVEVFVAGLDQPPIRTHNCTGSQCDQVVFFRDLVIERGTVRVTTDAGVRVTEISPVYSRVWPNGPDCPPPCIFALVSVPS